MNGMRMCSITTCQVVVQVINLEVERIGKQVLRRRGGELTTMRIGRGVLDVVGPIMQVIGNGCNRLTLGRTGSRVVEGTIMDMNGVLRIMAMVLLVIMAVRDKETAMEVFDEFSQDGVVVQNETCHPPLQ